MDNQELKLRIVTIISGYYTDAHEDMLVAAQDIFDWITKN